MPRHTLLPLTAAVLAAHAWLLWQLPAMSASPAAQTDAPPEVQHFATRSIAPPAPASPAAPARPVKKPAPPPTAPPPPPPPTVEALAAPDESNDLLAAAPLPAPAPAPAAEDALPEPAEPSVELTEPADTPALAETLQGVELSLPTGERQTVDTDLRLPAPARLAYEVFGQAKGFDYRASAQLLWQHDGHHYQARQEIKAFLLGSRGQTSTGQVSAAGLVPEQFSDQGRSKKTAVLDFAAQQAYFSSAAAPAAIGPGAQDRLSVFLQLSSLLATAPEHYPRGTEITFTTVGSNAAERWTFRVEELENLDLPLGALPARKIERLPRHPQDQRAALWLAPALDYLPARIRLTQANGDFVDLQLQAHTVP